MSSKIKVLMVDDEERFRETTAKLLNKKGFITTIAKSGEEAISIVTKKSLDVVILDIKMDGIDGLTALSEIKKIDPDIQVIMLTGHGNPLSADKALVYDAFDYLNKPCDIDILALKINDAFASKHFGAKQKDKKVKDIMLTIDDYTIISVEATVKEAVEKLMDSFKVSVISDKIMKAGHRSLLVFDDKENPVGLLSINDMIQAIRPAYLSAPKPSTADSVQYSPIFWEGLFFTQVKALANKKAGDLMSDAPPTIDKNTNLMEVADSMYKNKLRRLLVTDKNRVIGIIREQDIFFEITNIIL